MTDPVLRSDLEQLYARYASCLDNGRYEEWPDFFVEDGRYTLIPRENHDRGLPLATMALESRAMMKDRIYGVLNTLFFAPYYQRHVIGPLLIESAEDDIRIEANYMVVRTKRNALPEVFSTGRYLDRIVHTSEGLRFAEKLCIFDSEMVANSVIYPI